MNVNTDILNETVDFFFLFFYNITDIVTKGVSDRMKRFAALLFATVFLMFTLPSVAEDFEDFDDFDDFGEYDEFGDEMEFDDLGEASEEDVSNAKNAMNALSGYHDLDVQEEGDFKYEALEDGETCQAVRYTGFDEDVSVPEKMKNLSVKMLYQTFSDCTLVETVILPETIEIIDNMAFWKCTSLKTVEMQEGLKAIGRCSFGGCSELESLDFPESLEYIDEMVFIGCVKLKEVSFGKNLKSIGSQAFTACVNLEKVRIPSGTEIAEDAFEQCPKVEIERYDADV